MLQHLRLVPLGGLCNRIRAVASAMRICEKIGAHCEIVWEWGDFHSFFKPLYYNNITITNRLSDDFTFHKIVHKTLAHGGSASSWVLPTDSHEFIELRSRYVFGSLDEANSLDEADIRKWLPAPSNNIAEIVSTFSSEWKMVVGFHMRRTDHVLATEYSPDFAFIQEAVALIKQGNRIFLSCDNLETEAMMKSSLGSCVFSYPKNSDMPERWPRRETKPDDVFHDLVDLFLLAKTSYVLGSHGSSFSKLAMIYNGASLCRTVSYH